jgi:hypothetical protein
MHSRKLPLTWVGMVPFTLFALLFLIAPTMYIVIGAFRTVDGGFTLSNLVNLFQPTILASYWISIKISLATALVGCLVGFALAAAVDDSVLAPVMSQPSLPLPLTPKQRRDPGVSDAELKVVEQRAASEGLCVMGLRFSEDAMSPRDRFTTLKNRLGDAFEVIEIDSGKGNPDGIGRMAHSVLTDQVREVDGHPAYEARKRVVEFLTSRLT